MEPKIRKQITFDFEGQLAAINDQQVSNVVSELNDAISGEPYQYSDTQVKRALWKFFDDEIDELLENLEERFIDKYSKMAEWKQDSLLGDPELNVKEEAKLAHGDYLYDVRQEG